MKSSVSSSVIAVLQKIFVASLVLLSNFCEAQTFVSGNISGTWSPSGNPYIVSDNATVQGGQTLTIEPGVVVWIGAGVSINAYGNIQAIGTASQRIEIQSPISSQYWNQIYLWDNPFNTQTNLFNCCDFLNATNAVTIMGNSGYMALQINNCTFSNCVNSAIYNFGYSRNLNPKITCCLFSGTSNGCVLNIPAAAANAFISGNIFNNLAGTAILLQLGSGGANAATASLINNSIVNCTGGVNATGPWDAKIQSCIFKGCTSAITVSGSLSRTVNYNDFFGNGSNFVGYPSSYGNPIIQNRNGTPCDLLLNIFQDPQFVSATDFHLQGTSPCIDAGEGSAANFDNTFPPSLGTVTNDIGAFGGPNAGQWLVPTPSSFLTLAAVRYIGVTIYPPSAGHYELDYASTLTGTNNWIQITNMDLSAPFLYTEPASSPARFYRAEKLY
jgi:hypothetical protein